jgi:hypothetical protein
LSGTTRFVRDLERLDEEIWQQRGVPRHHRKPMARMPSNSRLAAQCTNPEISEHNETDGFAFRARRKAQTCQLAWRAFATPLWAQRHGFMFRYFRVGVLD